MRNGSFFVGRSNGGSGSGPATGDADELATGEAATLPAGEAPGLPGGEEEEEASDDAGAALACAVSSGAPDAAVPQAESIPAESSTAAATAVAVQVVTRCERPLVI
jgi:hypothetical protein